MACPAECAVDERWLPVPITWFERSHQVSDLGRVRSLDRMIWSRGHKSQYLHRGQLLTPTPDTRGYLSVCLSVVSVDGERHTASPLVHQLVLRAFAGLPMPGQEARHGPGGQHDNRLINLCYGTGSENSFDKYRDGTMVCGDKHPKAKLTEDIVRESRVRYDAREEDAASMARRYGVAEHTMWMAVTRRTWRWLDGVPA